MGKAIEIMNLTKYYGHSRGIVDLSMDVQEGEIFGFIGPNGAGKSTTIRLLLGLIYPNSGSAKIFGLDCFSEGKAIKEKIGYLPAEVHYYDDMKVKDLLYYSARFYGRDCKKRITELADILELDLTKKIETLSFGNRKKVGIIQSMLHEPKLLILDEPTSGLDPLMQNQFFDLLRQENKRGTTIFFSSHILSEVQKLCHKVAIIKEGRLLNVEHIESLISNKYKKIRIELTERAQFNPPILENVREFHANNNTVQFIYSGSMEKLIAYLASQPIENLWIEEPSLEEIFLHYYVKGKEG